MKLRPVLLVLALLAPVPPLAPSASDAFAAVVADDLCFGQMPTIVGTPGNFPDMQVIEGTEGVDVVVTNGAYGVDLLGGDDLLCITAEPDSVDGEYLPVYSTGDGSDRVDSSQRTDAAESFIPAVIVLGGGADEVVGGPLSERVIAADTSASDLDADVINTEGGNDSAFSGRNDVVRLGSGRDGVLLATGLPGGVLEGGPGGDGLTILFAHHGEQSWKLDNRAGRLSRDGEPIMVVESFSSFGVRARGNFVFIGSDDDESFEMHFNRSWTPLEGAIKVRMEGGDDRVSFTGSAQGAHFDGGAGADRFLYEIARQYARQVSVVFNMTSGLLRDTWPRGQTTTRRATHFEDVVLFPTLGRRTIKGTRAANWLEVWGPGPSTIYGKGGDDELLGGSGDSVLIGGSGYDIAHGEKGTDRCVAEVRLHCES